MDGETILFFKNNSASKMDGETILFFKNNSAS